MLLGIFSTEQKTFFDNRLLLVIPVGKEIGNACACPRLPGEGQQAFSIEPVGNSLK
jgi:hypothetical protein